MGLIISCTTLAILILLAVYFKIYKKSINKVVDNAKNSTPINVEVKICIENSAKQCLNIANDVSILTEKKNLNISKNEDFENSFDVKGYNIDGNFDGNLPTTQRITSTTSRNVLMNTNYCLPKLNNIKKLNVKT